MAIETKFISKKVLTTENLLRIFYFSILILLSYYAFFYLLGEKTLHVWDESRNAASAVEMVDNGNLLVPTFDGESDMWNTKPPLLISTQALFVKMLGVSEKSVRLPSAIAALVAVLFIFFFVSGFSKSSTLGFISSVVLITSPELLVFHGVRSADFESFLMFFSIAYALCIFGFIETNRNKLLYVGILCFVLAFLSKSTASLFFIPGIVLYVFLSGKTRKILQNKNVWFSVIAGFIVLLSFYLIRESLNPGYLKAVFRNEFGGRAFSSLEDHSEIWYFYIKTIWNNGFHSWYSLIFAGLILVFFEKSERIRKLFLFCLILAVSHLAFISFFKTKLIWYVIPEFPFWSILSALSIIMFVRLVLSKVKNQLASVILPILVAVMLVPAPVIRTIKTVKIVSLEENEQKNVKLFLRDEYIKCEELVNSEVKFISSGIKQNTLFYILKLKKNGFNVEYSTSDNLKCGDVILLNEKQKLASVIMSSMSADTIVFYNQDIIALKIIAVKK